MSSSKLARSRTGAAIAAHGSGPFFHEAKEYKSIDHTSNIALPEFDCFVWVGAVREGIFVNMNSKILSSFFETFLASYIRSEEPTQEYDESGSVVTESKTEKKSNAGDAILSMDEPFLQYLVNYVHHVIKLVSIEEITKLVGLYNQQYKVKGVYDSFSRTPLEFFLENKVGVCRHHAMFVAYLLVKSIRQAAIDATLKNSYKVHVYRADLVPLKESKLIPIGHGVIVFEMAPDKRYLLDSTRGNGQEGSLVLDLSMIDSQKKQLNDWYHPYDGFTFVSEMLAQYELGKSKDKEKGM